MTKAEALLSIRRARLQREALQAEIDTLARVAYQAGASKARIARALGVHRDTVTRRGYSNDR